MQKRAWILMVLFSACSLAGNGDLDERMQAILDQGIASHGIHGVSATVIFPDGRIWNGVSGKSHGDVDISPDMVFAIGSITKNVVAALTLKLVEEGALTLEDPLSAWLPSYPYVDDSITVRQLLNHTSGIYMYWNNQQIWDDLMAEPSRNPTSRQEKAGVIRIQITSCLP
jgi:D-alanyl-D-alanine carboxypeptidase